VTLAGKQEIWPVGAWASTAGLTITPGEKGKLQVAVAADVPPGLHWIRVYDPTGVSPPQPFVVGTLAERTETEDNNAPLTAEAIGTANVVINGRFAKGGDVDVFRIPLKAGQTLVASLAAHDTLGSPLDAVLQIVSA